MTGLSPSLRDATVGWIAEDPDPATRDELHGVLTAAEAGDPAARADLIDRMATGLAFGTAGLRGPMRAGRNGMNRAVVRRATAGLAGWLTAHGRAGGAVVVGYDARHGSAEFARDTAEVLAGAGFATSLLPGPLPTPVLAYTVRAMPAVAGVQITASHNPPRDNGYKVYLDAGAQLVPPADAEIEAAGQAAPGARSVPRSPDYTTLDDGFPRRYLDRVARLPRCTRAVRDAAGLRVVATAMHGVGAATLTEALRRAGFGEVELVTEQARPDPDFPTVAFPNPEEPGAAGLLLELAARRGADLAIALDPDADRCALGVADAAGRWRLLTGDETGCLLGEHILSTLDRSVHPDPLVATTIVSSSLLGRIATHHHARYAETLTGFKWIVRAGDGTGTGLVFGYEEALGLCVDPDVVRDKDGISAAVLACDLAATARAGGRSLLDELDALALRHGVHLTGHLTVRTGDPAAVLDRLRRAVPGTLAGDPVSTEDLRPHTDGLRLTGGPADRAWRVVVRPSGTEPKLKGYLQVVVPVAGRDRLAAARATAQRCLADLTAALTGLLR